jgi:hypothetical protein
MEVSVKKEKLKIFKANHSHMEFSIGEFLFVGVINSIQSSISPNRGRRRRH